MLPSLEILGFDIGFSMEFIKMGLILGYGIFGEGSQISTDQNRLNSASSLLIG